MDGLSLHSAVPVFVQQIIKDADVPKSQCLLSFVDIVDRLNNNHFQSTPALIGLSHWESHQSNHEPGNKDTQCKSSTNAQTRSLRLVSPDPRTLAAVQT
jgi:hypothetical protein